MFAWVIFQKLGVSYVWFQLSWLRLGRTTDPPTGHMAVPTPCPLLLALEGWKLHHLIILGASNCLCRGLWQNEDSWTVSQSLFPMLYLRSTLLLHSSPHKCAPPPSSLPSSGMGWRPVLWSPPVVLYKKYLSHKHRHLNILACWVSGKMNLVQQHISLTVKLFHKPWLPMVQLGIER